MTGFAAFHWPCADRTAEATASRLRASLRARGWRSLVENPGWVVLADSRAGQCVTRLHPDGNTIVIGRLFDRAATASGSVAPAALPPAFPSFQALCEHLLAHAWGGYVALGRDPGEPSRLDIFRDPVGMLDCAVWACGALQIASSRPEELLLDAAPVGLAVDWQRIAGLVRFPGSVGETLPVRGVHSVPPGAFVQFVGADSQTLQLWDPTSFCRPAPVRDGHTLPLLIDACVAAWSTSARRAVAELSGGLDSAIVATGLATLPHSPVAGWFNYRAIDAEGDERTYARAVAGRLHLPLTEILQDERVIDMALIDSIPVTLRPAVGSISFFHDRDLAARAAALGADTLITGQGGDALFFQPATPLIGAELRHDDRPWRDRLAGALDLAAWTGHSVWSIIGSAVRNGRRHAAIGLPRYRVDVVPDAMPSDARPLGWLTHAGSLPPAKQLQILNLAACRAAFGASWCASGMTVLHPLMSQPLLEHVLPIPALALTGGRRDRALIRAAYAGRLPAELLERRGKGSLTPFYGRMLARSVPFLRAYLLDGRLVAEGCLDGTVVDALLDEDVLMRTNVYTELFVALLMEHWARSWANRLVAAVPGAR